MGYIRVWVRVGWQSLVGTAIRYELDSRGIEYR